ncbi:MAG: hypothetical protein AAGH79_11005, partial [Bacteroidota bacterium]
MQHSLTKKFADLVFSQIRLLGVLCLGILLSTSLGATSDYFNKAVNDCELEAGSLNPVSDNCLSGEAILLAETNEEPELEGNGQLVYVLTSGSDLVIEAANTEPEFSVSEPGDYRIHAFVYDPATFNINFIQFGSTTGIAVNNLINNPNYGICADLDVTGAFFHVAECPCSANAGSLVPETFGCIVGSLDLVASTGIAPEIPAGFEQLYVLTLGPGLVIQDVNTEPVFTITEQGDYRIHSLVYDPATLDLSIVQFGVTTGLQVNSLLEQGGGDICASLDVLGAAFHINDCPCGADAGTLTASSSDCVGGVRELVAEIDQAPTAPAGFEILYVLTSGTDLVIEAVNADPIFQVEEEGLFTIHTLVYDPATLDLSIVEFGVTTGFDVNGLIVQGGGDICAALDVAGAPFDVEACPCDADAGTLNAAGVCVDGNLAQITANPAGNAVVPAGYEVIYVLTSGPGLIIEAVGATPEFVVSTDDNYTIHTLVYDPATLDLSIVEFGVTTGFDVNGLLIQGGGDICASLDVAGVQFNFGGCDVCLATAGSLNPASDNCLDGTAELVAEVGMMPNIPTGYEVLYVLTSGADLVIQAVNADPVFEVDANGTFTIHTLVYDPATLDLSIVEFGVTTGFDVNGLLIQGGGDICAALDVAGAPFEVITCCDAEAGTLTAISDNCLDGNAILEAAEDVAPVIPAGYEVLYVLTSGTDLVIQDVNASPEFTVESTGLFTIHTLVYDPATLDLSIVQFGVTTGFDVNGLLIQGGGDICASLLVAGAEFQVEDCPCEAEAGTLKVLEDNCLEDGAAFISAEADIAPVVPAGYEVIYVLTSGTDLVIQGVNATPEFTVEDTGIFTIHTLVYNPLTLDLSIVEIGVTTGFDVNGLLQQGGGTICAALDVPGASFMVEECPCEADAGTLTAITSNCLDGNAVLEAAEDAAPVVPAGYEVLYVLTSGAGLVIEDVNASPEFTVESTGLFTIHTLVYDPATLDLSIVQFGVTTGFDVNGLLIQGGGDICASLLVAGAEFQVEDCPCTADAGTLTANSDNCLDGEAQLEAIEDVAPVVPAGYEVIYVLTSGTDLVIQGVNASPDFTVADTGLYTIHTLVYNPLTLDLSIVEPGVTTGFDVNGLLQQGGGDICAS